LRQQNILRINKSKKRMRTKAVLFFSLVIAGVCGEWPR